MFWSNNKYFNSIVLYISYFNIFNILKTNQNDTPSGNRNPIRIHSGILTGPKSKSCCFIRINGMAAINH